jgi:outer membrane biosynthesis protein TonB
LKLTSSEPKVEIVRNGKVIGTTPFELKNLKEGETIDYVARKSGFSETSSSVSNNDKKAVIEKDIYLERVAAKDPEPKPVAKNEPKPEPKNEPKPEPKPVAKNEPKPEPKPQPKNEPKPEPKPVAAKGSGKAAFTSSPVGAEIWVDGKNTGKKTPLPKTAALEFSIGKHKVVFKQGGKSSAPVEFDITADNKDNPAVVKGTL